MNVLLDAIHESILLDFEIDVSNADMNMLASTDKETTSTLPQKKTHPISLFFDPTT